jgi:hypothetical protein
MEKQTSVLSTMAIDTAQSHLVQMYMSLAYDMNQTMLIMREHARNIQRNAATIISNIEKSYRTDIASIESNATQFMILQTRLDEQANTFRFLQSHIRETIENGAAIIAECRQNRIDRDFLFVE